MRVSIVVATDLDGIIGRDNRLPWHLPADLQRFKAVTMGKPMIMGRKTWESLPEKFRPLPGRRNIVVTRNAGYGAPGASVVTSLPDAMAAAAGSEAFVIGGAELYRAALALADRLQLTEIDADFAGDTWFPARDSAQWREVAREAHADGDGLAYAFVTWQRIR